MPGTVLIVEDEADLAGLLSDVLQSAGYEVALTTATRAAARSIDVSPVAVVTDYLMPGLNGPQVVDQIRAASPGEGPPVVLVTGLPNAEELAAETGADAYLHKPFDMDEFIAVVDMLAQGGER